MKHLRSSWLLAAGLLLSACVYRYYGEFELVPGGPQREATAVEISREVAKRWGLHESKNLDELNAVQTLRPRVVLASYHGIFDTAPDHGYATVNMRFSVERLEDNGAIAFSLFDLDNGRETHILRQMADKLREEIATRLPDVAVSYRSGRSEGSFYAP